MKAMLQSILNSISSSAQAESSEMTSPHHQEEQQHQEEKQAQIEETKQRHDDIHEEASATPRSRNFTPTSRGSVASSNQSSIRSSVGSHSTTSRQGRQSSSSLLPKASLRSSMSDSSISSRTRRFRTSGTLHRSSSSGPRVPAGWFVAPDSQIWKDKYEMGNYLGSVGRFGKLYSCFSLTNEEDQQFTVKVNRKSRWSFLKSQNRYFSHDVFSTTSSSSHSHSNLHNSNSPAINHNHPKSNKEYSVDRTAYPPSEEHHYLNHPNRTHLQEYTLLRQLQHSTILNVYDLIEDSRNFYVVTEFFDPPSQSLRAHLQKRQAPFSEKECAILMQQILSCVHYCHDHSIILCNIKLDVFCVLSETLNGDNSEWRIKLTSFDHAVVLGDLFEPNSDLDNKLQSASSSVSSSSHNDKHNDADSNNLRLMEPRGTLKYMAPEMLTLDRSYAFKCDLWSAGIVMYLLLANEFPLDGTTFAEIQALILNTLHDPHWLIRKFREEQIWHGISDEAKHFLYELLQPEETNRPSAETALKHVWMETLQDDDDHGKATTPSTSTAATSLAPAVVTTRDSTISNASSALSSISEFSYRVHSKEETPPPPPSHISPGRRNATPISRNEAKLRFDSLELTSSILTATNNSSNDSNHHLPPIQEMTLDQSTSLHSQEESLSSQGRPSSCAMLQSTEKEALDTFLQTHDKILEVWHQVNDRLRNRTDLDLNQSLTRDDVRDAYYATFETELDEQNLEQVFSGFDAAELDAIAGLDFFVAVLNEKNSLFTPEMQEAFDTFDNEQCGLVPVLLLAEAIRSYATLPDLTQEQHAILSEFLKQIVADAEDLTNHRIALEELVAMILETAMPKSFSTTGDNGLGVSNNQEQILSPEKLPNGYTFETPPPPTEEVDVLAPPSFDSSVSGTSSAILGSTPRRRSSLLDRLSLKFSAKHFISQRPGRISHYYDLTDYVNEGGCGAVWFCTQKATGVERAVKLVRKSQTADGKYNQRVLDEFLILRELDHPNILRQYELFEDENFFYIVMDAARGGDLCDELDEFGAFIESAAAYLMKQLLTCINYLHSCDIVHCDLKPENILLEENMELNQIKIIDFGFASDIRKAKNCRLSKRWGTLQYSAPEVIGGDYGKKVDIWSAGVICYLLLSDEFPFYGADSEELVKKILAGSYSFTGHHWSNVSDLAKDFVSRLLTVEEKNRPTADEALMHPWIVQAVRMDVSGLGPGELDNIREALTNMRTFSADSKLKQAVSSLIASQFLQKEEKQALDQVFRRLDAACNGRLSSLEIRHAYLCYLGEDMTDKEAKDIVRRVDTAKSGYIDYSEFVVSAMNDDALLGSGKLKSAFDVFDIEKAGRISPANLRSSLSESLTGDDTIDVPFIAQIIDEVDSNQDGVISYEDFVKAMYSSSVK